MTSRYDWRDRWFMRKALLMRDWYEFLFLIYDRLGWQEKANAAYDKSFDWFERGWECKNGM